MPAPEHDTAETDAVMIVVERIADLFEQSGLTQAEFANLLGRTPTYIRTIQKRERNNFTLASLLRFSKVFGVPIGALVNPCATLEPEATLAERVTSLFEPVTVRDHVGSIDVSFTPEDVAESTGVRADQIRALMDGTLTFEDAPVMLLKRIAEFFGIPVMYLIDASDDASGPV